MAKTYNMIQGISFTGYTVSLLLKQLKQPRKPPLFVFNDNGNHGVFSGLLEKTVMPNNESNYLKTSAPLLKRVKT